MFKLKNQLKKRILNFPKAVEYNLILNLIFIHIEIGFKQMLFRIYKLEIICFYAILLQNSTFRNKVKVTDYVN